jgi:hypothetical protein
LIVSPVHYIVYTIIILSTTNAKMVAVGCLPDGNVVIWFQTVLYFLASIFGFFVCIPMGILLRNFQGSCILFAQILDWRPAVIWPWSETACDYVLFMNLAVNIFYATFMGFVSLLIAYKYKIGRSKNLTKLHNWHVAYILQALNPLFLIINILIFVLEVCSVSVVVAGTTSFCKYVFEYLAKSTTMMTQLSTTPISLASTTTTQAICNFVYSTIDTLTNETVTYTVNTCTTTFSTASTTTLAIGTLSSCSALQTWSAWWSQMRIIRGRDYGIKGDNFFVCLVMASVASFLLVIVWLIHMAMNVGMLCRVCSCDIAEEKQHSMDQTRLIAQRRSRLATPSVTPGGGPGRHTPQTFQGDLPEKPPQAGAIPRQYQQHQQPSAKSPMSPEPRSYQEDDYPEKKVSPPSSELDLSDRGLSPQPQYHLPPVSRRMEPSPRRPAAEPQVVSSPDTSMLQLPPAYHQLPPVQARSPPSKLV